MLITQDAYVADSVSFFDQYSNDVFSEYGLYPTLYAVHIRPIKAEITKIKHSERLFHVQSLVLKTRYKVNSHLLRKPRSKRNESFLIQSRDFIESYQKSNLRDIHHSHSVWALHPTLNDEFQDLLVPFDKSLINSDERQFYINRAVFTLKDAVISPLKDQIRSIMIEEVTDPEKILKYCSKHWDKQQNNPLGFMAF